MGDLKIAAVSAPPLDRGDMDDARKISHEMTATTATTAISRNNGANNSSNAVGVRPHAPVKNDAASATTEVLVVMTKTMVVRDASRELVTAGALETNGFLADTSGSSRSSHGDGTASVVPVSIRADSVVENGGTENNTTTDDSDELETDSNNNSNISAPTDEQKRAQEETTVGEDEVAAVVENPEPEVEVGSPADVEEKVPHRAGQRKRKRSKRLGFSGSRPKQKHQSICPPLQVHLPDVQGAQDCDTMGTPESPILKESISLYESKPSDAAWDWSMADVYYDPIVQENLDHLVRVRKRCANILAANPAACQHATAEVAHLRGMLADADDAVTARVRPLRRGRRYRDVWDEEDFLTSEHKRDALSVEKKRAFGAQDLLVSNHDLVHGYDDELFEKFIHRLESHAGTFREATAADPPPSGGSQKNSKSCDPSGPKHKAKKHASLNEEILPDIPVQQCHPAAWGSWVIKKQKVMRRLYGGLCEDRTIYSFVCDVY